MPSDQEKDNALVFLQSLRGQLIMGQALSVAVKTMEAIEPAAMRELSNIDDMKYLIKNLFPIGQVLEEAREVAALTERGQGVASYPFCYKCGSLLRECYCSKKSE